MCCVSHIKKIFISSSAGNQNMSWLQFKHHQANNAVYATELFVKGTAVFLGIDIYINSPGCNSSHPYNVVNPFFFIC